MKTADQMTDLDLGDTVDSICYESKRRHDGSRPIWSEIGERVRMLFEPHPRSRAADDELATVRAEVDRTARVVQALALAEQAIDKHGVVPAELHESVQSLIRLRARQAELEKALTEESPK